MKEYPSTSKPFRANGKTHKMRKFTLGLQSEMEDENQTVTYLQVIKSCTDMTDDDIASLDIGQLDDIVSDIQEFTYENTSEAGGEPKKP